jgi:hypothetical protein
MAWCPVNKKAQGQLYLYLFDGPKILTREFLPGLRKSFISMSDPFINLSRFVRKREITATLESLPKKCGLQIEVFWVVALCRVVVGYQRFGGPHCLHLRGKVKM